MPALFSPDSLRASLQPLAAGQPLSSEALAYQRYYGLDFPHRQAPVKRQLGRFTAGGYEIVSQVWWPASSPVATLFVIHGFYDHMGLYRHVIEWGLDRGFVVIACDLPGHGLSASWPSAWGESGKSLAAFADAVAARFGCTRICWPKLAQGDADRLFPAFDPDRFGAYLTRAWAIVRARLMCRVGSSGLTRTLTR